MKLLLTFLDDNPSKPIVGIQYGEKQVNIRRERWCQFLALLTHRLLTGKDDGWVTLDDIANLSSFHQARDKVIGKYLATSRFEFQSEITRFFNRTMDVTTTGPYKLILGRECVETDLAKLEQYLNLITVRPLPDRMDCQSLWHSSQITLDKFELKSCLQILQRYIQIAGNEEPVPEYQLPLAYIRMARAARLAVETDVNVDACIENAMELSKSITAPYEQKLLVAYTYAVQAIILSKDVNTFVQIKQLNDKALALLDEIDEDTPDKICLLAHINYTNYNASVFNSTDPYKPSLKWADQSDLDRALELYARLENADQPQLVDLEKGVIEGVKLLMTAIRCVLDDIDLPDDFIERYFDVVASDNVSKFITLNTGIWIRHYYIKQKELAKAHSFGQECLIQHVRMHETQKFQRLVESQKKLKSELNSSK